MRRNLRHLVTTRNFFTLHFFLHLPPTVGQLCCLFYLVITFPKVQNNYVRGCYYNGHAEIHTHIILTIVGILWGKKIVTLNTRIMHTNT